MGKQKKMNKKIVKQLKKTTSTSNVFKVAGAKSLKAKTKAKAKVLTVQLQKWKTQQDVTTVNEQMSKLQKEVIAPKKASPKKQTPKKTNKPKGKANQKLTKVVTVALDTMKM